MKVALKPGVELDILTQAELHATMTTLLSGFARGPLTDRVGVAIDLDGSGSTFRGSTSAVAVPVFRVPAGYTFALHRITFKPDGSTLADPFVNADGYLEIQRQGQYLDGVSLDTPGLPVAFTSGNASAPVFDNNDRVEILIVGGPADTAVAVYVQGTLAPLTLV